MSTNDFIHLYCCRDWSPEAMCGYWGPDEGPDAERLPQCPTCVERQHQPCGNPSCPDLQEGET